MATKDTIRATAERLGLSMRAEFVPWSKSRNKGEKCPSLNWKVTILRNGREVMTTDYMAGCGHCPSYKQFDNSWETAERIKEECEHGRPFGRAHGAKPILPELADVLHSLASDADAIDYPTFEEWAESYGDDPDSRKAEKIYRACLETALKLRAALGEAGFAELREAVRDY